MTPIIQNKLFYSRIAIALVVMAFWGYVINQHVPFTGIRTIAYTFERPHGAIGVFRPSVRYELINGERGQKIAKVIEDPVYFDIKSLVPYQSASFSFTYQKHTARTVQLALKGTESEWKFTTIPFFEKNGGDWIVATADVDLSHVSRENNKYTFALSVPGLVANVADEYILVSKMDVRMVRPSFLEMLQKRL